MSDSHPIGFFDSGVGLLSVLAETKKLLPREIFVIFADQGHNPYGEKSAKQIKSYATDATNFLIKKHNIKMMVLACNTATVLALGDLRKKFKIPIIGTVPAVKPAFKKSKGVKVAIMSTPLTAKSKYLTSLVSKFGNDKNALKLGCRGLEEAIEILDHKKIDQILEKYLAKVKKFKPDVVILGCTHYPLIKNKIQKELGNGVTLLDSGEAIAKRVRAILKETKSFSSRRQSDIFYTTGDPKQFSRVASILLKKKINAFHANI